MHFDGAYAERIAVPEALVAPMPDTLSYEEGALVEPLAVAMHAVNITPFALLEFVVVVGAGAIGLLTLLAARLRGAGSIVVTDQSAHRLAVARSLGADLSVDVTAQDPVEIVQAATDGRGADAVLEAVGIGATASQSLRLVRSGGNVTWIGNSAPLVELPMQELVTRELTLRGSYAFREEFEHAADAIAEGTIDVRPLIERKAPLDEGSDVFRELGAGELDAIKVVLMPNG